LTLITHDSPLLTITSPT